ncbi:uncharacterized protein LOC126552610 [Aphis gossypii]|uniref:uncharacterized protein LOC126552610 n=1 Tax=Aphis gossypii TaxID=80765 RepID=UPI002158BD19|nr:uncharacterized protein LOC126552610 [Aphis gossypii]
MYQCVIQQSKTSAYTLFIENHGPYQPINAKLIRVNGRSFKTEWYSQFPWIEFSELLQTAFCFNCRVFPSCNVEKSFTVDGFKNWKKGIMKFTQHQQSIAHKESTCKLSSHKVSKKKGTVISEMNSAHKTTVTQNRKYIKCLLETLLFCARQGIAFRGHNETETSTNCGNFLELLKLRSNDNEVIQKYFIEKEMSFTYTSPEIEAIRSVLENLKTIFQTLSEIESTDTHSGSDAASLLRSIKNFEFIFCLHVLREMLGMTNALNLYLQSPKNPPKIPRMSKVPNKHGGGNKQPVYTDVQHFFKINFYLPLLDLLTNDISIRFSENDLDILQALYEVICEENSSNEVIKKVCVTYSLIEAELKGELSILNRMFKNSVEKDSLENRVDFF